jgi:hypothetical protein
MTCDHQRLLGLARGELAAAEAREVESHAAACAACAEELAWLRTEHNLFRARRGTPLPPHAFAAVERRVAAEAGRRATRRRLWVQRGALGAFVAAAAAMVFFAWRTPARDRGGAAEQRASGDAPASSAAPTRPSAAEDRPVAPSDPGRIFLASSEDGHLDAPAQELLKAELTYQSAITTLEAEYAAERPRLAPAAAEQLDEVFAHLREIVNAARALPSADVASRRRVLHAYAAYMRTMQAVVLEGSR